MENIKILYCEDEADIREMVEFALEDEGFELIPCSSGAMALEQAGDFHADLLLLYVMMPGMDGPTTLAKLRELPHLASTPAIFMTAKVQPAEVAHYRNLGAIEVITKPFDAMALADRLHALLESCNE